MLETVYKKYIELINYCNSNNFDTKMFNVKLNEYTKLYKALGHNLQGELSLMINFNY